MIRDFARLITLSVIMALVAAGAARPAQAFVDDVHGKEWRQLTETVGPAHLLVERPLPAVRVRTPPLGEQVRLSGPFHN